MNNQNTTTGLLGTDKTPCRPYDPTDKTLVCIGAGPKSLAIALLAKVVRDVWGIGPKVVIIEREAIGANWRGGDAGLTDGEFPLDSSPLKDLGFPYDSGYGPDIDHSLGHYSFVEFLKSTGQYVDFICRGDFRIPHRLFSQYMEWAAKAIDVEVRRAAVRRILPTKTGLRLELLGDAGPAWLDADGVVLTGPGESKRLSVQDDDATRVFDGRTYWPRRDLFQSIRDGRVAVVGGGLSAATVTKSLVLSNSTLKVDMITRQGFLIAQSAGFTENRLCSLPPDQWADLPLAQRREVLNRINNGVVEVSTKAFLDAHTRVAVVGGAVTGVRVVDNKAVVFRGDGSLLKYDAVVVAIGFDPLAGLGKLFAEQTANAVWRHNFEAGRPVDKHLRLTPCPCNVHVPNMGDLAHGPGLALLSCLGTVARRILSAYLSTSTTKRRDGSHTMDNTLLHS